LNPIQRLRFGTKMGSIVEKAPPGMTAIGYISIQRMPCHRRQEFFNGDGSTLQNQCHHCLLREKKRIKETKKEKEQIRTIWFI